MLTHWVWTYSGWASPTRTTGSLLIGSGVYDTVGSGAVHAVGGWAGLAGTLNPSTISPDLITPHPVPDVPMGESCSSWSLWFLGSIAGFNVQDYKVL